jgi:hypothetical protein
VIVAVEVVVGVVVKIQFGSANEMITMIIKE